MLGEWQYSPDKQKSAAITRELPASYVIGPPPFGLQPPPPQSRDAGYGFSIAWTGRKGEELGDFVFVRLYRGGIDGDFRKIA